MFLLVIVHCDYCAYDDYYGDYVFIIYDILYDVHCVY